MSSSKLTVSASLEAQMNPKAGRDAVALIKGEALPGHFDLRIMKITFGRWPRHPPQSS
jgi:hypothetical protein